MGELEESNLYRSLSLGRRSAIELPKGYYSKSEFIANARQPR